MAVKEEKVVKFIWKLENYSYCWNKTGDFLQSPDFEMDVFEGSSWCLKLYPRGVSACENYVSVYLGRLDSSKGPLGITIDYEIALLRPDGTLEYVKETKNRSFRKGYTFGFDNLAAREEILGPKRSALLPEDILTVQCRLFPKTAELKSSVEIIAKTHIEVERFVSLIERELGNYSFNSYIQGNGVCRSKGSSDLIIKLYGSPLQEAKILEFQIVAKNNIKTFYSKIGILDSNNTVSRFLMDKHCDGSLYHTYVSETVSSISLDELRKKKYLYLPNGKLTLHYDLTISLGVHYSQIEMVVCDNAFTYVPAKVKVPSKRDLPLKKYSCFCSDNYFSLKNDFQNLLQEGTVCDFTIKVGGENLHVHKAVLCARSPVFKAMLTSSMKETEKNMMDISDVEIDTVRRMLTFMYTDTIHNLDWENAHKLYFVADKYVLFSMKRICSDVLKQNLCVSNIGDVLKLASMHADDDLKKTTLEFVYNHETEVMCSTEWKTFMTEEVHLAAEIMHQILLKRAGSHR